MFLCVWYEDGRMGIFKRVTWDIHKEVEIFLLGGFERFILKEKKSWDIFYSGGVPRFLMKNDIILDSSKRSFEGYNELSHLVILI